MSDDGITDRVEENRFDRLVSISERLLGGIEIIAAYVLVVLFAVGVFDLSLQIVQRTLSGAITDPLVVVGFIDTALLLFIIVEVYQTVVAYAQESETREIVQLVAYTGIIAMVRKVIIFRSEVYDDKGDALLTAGSYALLLLVLGILLYIERTTRQ
ncbi:phosphate-starvation-inducible PsiE family protein [Haloarchaeobius iranensis]|uniref:Uncharacterized membrane protein, DUF373 family n=1 Tax=Haloarchaeobius iranensis TaxID=996166 RepID=A0A1H0BH51_9EURY|nr:phosphate-starvation-inducible PsiE family protein [Haloarchaeobius iranensis]SDN44905.1 Uncharacterized membrane protein, DUF373 family [Haloarchaeobius iranensis]